MSLQDDIFDVDNTLEGCAPEAQKAFHRIMAHLNEIESEHEEYESVLKDLNAGMRAVDKIAGGKVAILRDADWKEA